MLMGRGAETILGFTLPDRESLVKTLGMCSYQSVGSRCHQELGAGIWSKVEERVRKNLSDKSVEPAALSVLRRHAWILPLQPALPCLKRVGREEKGWRCQARRQRLARRGGKACLIPAAYFLLGGGGKCLMKSVLYWLNSWFPSTRFVNVPCWVLCLLKPHSGDWLPKVNGLWLYEPQARESIHKLKEKKVRQWRHTP